MRHDFKVVIVGAGLAGLAAALKLHNAGIKNIIILEAQSEAGGRVKSIGFGDGFVELGAQWLHGTNSDLYRIAEEHDLLLKEKSFEGLGNYYDENGKIISPSHVMEVSSEVSKIISNLEKLNDEEEQPSVGDFMISNFENYLNSLDDPLEKEVKKKLFDWHLRFQIIDNSCTDLKKLSAEAFGDYEFCGGEDYVNFKYGFQSLIDVLVSKLPEGCLITNCPVKEIIWREKIYSLEDPICEVVTELDEVFNCDHVLVTCSAGYLKENWSIFSPQLPTEYRKGLNCIGFDTINKVFLGYSTNWWEDLKGIQFAWDSQKRKSQLQGSPLLWTVDLSGFDPLVGHENTLVGWVGGDGAKLMENFLSMEIAEHCTLLLRDITSNPNVPHPTSCVHTAWCSNKFIRGAYSHIRTERDHQKSYLAALSKPVESTFPCGAKHPVIILAGEALHKSHYSTTHGAFENGAFQAEKLISYIKEQESAIKL